MNKGIQKVFANVPDTYELVNHILTFGFDILWRKKAARIAAGLGGVKWIDMCSGTGEMAVYLSRMAKDTARVFAADFSIPMLTKIASKPAGRKVTCIVSDVQTASFTDNTFDLITISFATRNINVNKQALLNCYREFYRILKPGGYFITVETSQPESTIIRNLFHLYVKLFVQPVGSLISGYKPGYAMLSKTIRAFYPAEGLADIMRTAGFDEVSYKKLLLGIAAIHKAYKN